MNYKLKDLIQIKNGSDYKNLGKGNVPVYGTGGIMTYVDDFLYDGESVLLPRKGTLDNVMYVNGRFWTVDTMYWTIVNTEKVLPQYLYYYLSLLDMSSRDSGSTLPSMTFDAYYMLDIDIPSIDVQQRVIDTISPIDKKIRNNDEINDNLLKMARSIYDYWFIQFDFPNDSYKPYKTSGGSLSWDAQIKRSIPNHWSVTEFQNICTIRRGASPRPIDIFMDKTHKGMPWVKISDATSSISPFMIKIKEHIIPEGVSKSVHVEPGTLIVSNSATPGIPKYIQIDACVHDGWLVLDDYAPELRYYLYFVIEMVRDSLVNIATGSIFKNLNTDYLKEYKCVIPPSNVMKEFDRKISPIMSKLLETEKENLSLKSLRDYILPFLMNGQATIAN